MRTVGNRTIFFASKVLEDEGPAEWRASVRSGGVDPLGLAPCNEAMAAVGAGEKRPVGLERIGRSKLLAPEVLPTGIASLDEMLEGGLVAGLLAELVSPEPGSGGQAVLLHLLEASRRSRLLAALIDGADGLDPQSTPPALLEHLLWVRCSSVGQALKAADVALRDENLGMVIVDLRGCEERELRRVASSEWYRLQRLAGRSGSFACVLTPRPMVVAAQTRVSLELGERSAAFSRTRLTLGDLSFREQGEALRFEALRLGGRRQNEFANLIGLATGS